jgi:hypothetical protein
MSHTIIGKWLYLGTFDSFSYVFTHYILHLIIKGGGIRKQIVKKYMYCILIGNEDKMKFKLQQFFFFLKCLHYCFAYCYHNYFESCALNVVVLNLTLDSIKFLDFMDNKVWG